MIQLKYISNLLFCRLKGINLKEKKIYQKNIESETYLHKDQTDPGYIFKVFKGQTSFF